MHQNLKPVLKWAGGKRQLLPDLLNNIPPYFGKYYEPFIGGGAFLISLYSTGKIKNAVISDINPDLSNLYSVVKNQPVELIEGLNSIKFKNNSEDYYAARDLFNSIHDPVKKSVLLIYLNRHGFNGLYRVNSQNKFNVPFGKYTNPHLPSPENIMALSNMLKSCDVLNDDFEIAVKFAVKGDFVYFDPPYMPLTRTSSFTGYTLSGFTIDDQKRLFKVFKELDQRGVYVMESNSSTDLLKEMYSKFNLKEVNAKRNINSVGSKRNNIKELIITNY